MSDAFNPYHKWLGIPAAEQPADHYRLLAITRFEDDPDVIEGAADRQMAHIRNFQTGKHSAVSQRILNELAAAKLCLLDAKKKAAYDGDLRGKLPASPTPQPVIPTARPIVASPTPSLPRAPHETVASATIVIDSGIPLQGLGKRQRAIGGTARAWMALAAVAIPAALFVSSLVQTKREATEVAKTPALPDEVAPARTTDPQPTPPAPEPTEPLDSAEVGALSPLAVDPAPQESPESQAFGPEPLEPMAAPADTPPQSTGSAPATVTAAPSAEEMPQAQDAEQSETDALVGPDARAEDSIGQSLDAARRAFETKAGKLRQELSADIGRQVAAAKRKRQTKSVDELTSERDAFDRRHELPKSVSTTKYLSGLEQAQHQLMRAYEDAVRKYARAGIRQKADEIETELHEFKTNHGIAFQANTVWANSGWVLTITGRNGQTFTGLYTFEGNNLAVVGAINGNKIQWSGTDVRVMKGRWGADDHDGTMTCSKGGDKIDFTWRNASGRTGTFTVYRQ